MSKFIFCILLLLHYYNCQNLDNAKIFKIPRKSDSKLEEFKVRKGETFALQFYSNPTTGFSWHFLNKDEVSDSLQLLTSKYVAPKTPVNLVGAGGYMYYYFKGVEVTNETQILKFSYTRGKDNGLTTLVKVTVY